MDLNSTDLKEIRTEIDAVNAELRERLLHRATLVSKVAAAKATTSGSIYAPLRPMREMQQMLELVAWQKTEAPVLSVAGLVSIWREMIGMALALQGGVTVRASQDTMLHARAHFGASLEYEIAAPRLDDLVDNPRLVAVLSLDEATAPPAGVTVFARLPLVGVPQALCYSAIGPEDGRGHEGAVSLVCRSQALAGDHVLFTGTGYTLVETGRVDDGCTWGRYLTLGAAA